MKTIALSIYFMVLTFASLAQDNANTNCQAIFNAKKSVFETSTEPNTIIFTITNINDNAALDRLKKTSAMYSNHFTVDIESMQESHSAICKIVFNDKSKTGILNRFFVANNIQEIIINNSKVNREQFFNTPESW